MVSMNATAIGMISEEEVVDGLTNEGVIERGVTTGVEADDPAATKLVESVLCITDVDDITGVEFQASNFCVTGAGGPLFKEFHASSF